MRKNLFLLFLLTVCTAMSAEFADRWFYLSRNLQKDADVDDIAQVVQVARKGNLNGMLFACSIENVGVWDAKRLARLEKVKDICRKGKIEIIPIIWSTGYGTMLGVDPNLVEGLFYKDVPFKVNGREARLVTVDQEIFANGGFEEHTGNRFKIDGFTEEPGKISFADTEVFHGGNCSIRLETPNANKYGHARICFNLTTRPYANYQFTCWVKTKNFQPKSVHAFRIQHYAMTGKAYGGLSPLVEPTQDWKQYTFYFTTGEETKSRLYLGQWGGDQGTMWIDDCQCEEIGVTNVIRRPGTPFTVKNADTGVEYVEGKDYQPVPGLKSLSQNRKETSLVLKLTADSAIKDGDNLLISYYRPARNGSQVSTCMSEPKLYELFQKSAENIMKVLKPQKWFLSMDEVRAGGTCAACRNRNLDMAHIIGDCVTKQYNIIKGVCPKAEVYIWSDMFDPKHNAHDNYFNCRGTFAGSWNYIPKDIIISCWYGKIAEDSFAFFTKEGFRVQAASYYDADDLDNCIKWLDVCKKTPRCTGIMYTTWRNKYKLLADFAELIKH